jgi:hypothetical protein
VTLGDPTGTVAVMAEPQGRYTIDELERMTPTERQAVRDQLPAYSTVDDLPEPFRSEVIATIDRIDEIRPRRPEA